MKKGGWVYILTNRPNGTLYIGVTANLAQRIAQHQTSTGDSFTARHNLTRLIYAENYDDITNAIAREKQLKHWNRAWKVRLIVAGNPNWDELPTF